MELRDAVEAMWAQALADPEIYLFGNEHFRGFVTTVDEHDFDNPVKDFPDRPHLRYLTRRWTDIHQLAIAKSRQLMISWWGMACISRELWLPGRNWAVICRKFEPADKLLDRMYGIMERVPESIRPKITRKEGVIRVHHGLGTDSRVRAFPQDTDAPRSETFSGLWIDEAAFTDNLPDIYAAAKPTVMGGGKLIEVSSPNGRGMFYEHLFDGGRVQWN